MKLSSILCGAAAIALIASAAEASNRGGPGQGGPGHGGPGNPPVSSVGGPWGEHVVNHSNPVPADHDPYSNYAGTTWDGVPSTSIESRWAAYYEGKDNVGDAGQRDGATFTLKGKVSPHCVFYTGSDDDLTFNFGQIGIYASENHGPALAFDQVDGASLKFRTNLAGCNTKNKVSLARTQAALKTNPGFGYDAVHFTTEIPYSVKANFRAPAASANSLSAEQRLLQLTTGWTGTRQETYGAWKSPLTITVDLGKSDKSLVAGDYTGSFSVVIQAL